MKEKLNIDYVVCKLCGKKGKTLTQHLKIKHTLTRREYEDTYHSPAVCLRTHARKTELAQQWNDRLSSDPELVVKCAEARRKAVNLPQVREAQRKYMREWLNSEEGRDWNRRNMNYVKNLYGGEQAFQAMATEGKRKSALFHEVHSRIASDQLKRLHQDKEWEKQLVAKAFNSSRKEYIDVNNEIVYLRSSYELTLHNYLVTHNIPHEYESVRIEYKMKPSNKSYTYIPDFYLPDKNLLLEVKPDVYVLNKVNQLKHQASIEAGFIHLFVTEKELKDLNSFFHNVIYKIGSKSNCI